MKKADLILNMSQARRIIPILLEEEVMVENTQQVGQVEQVEQIEQHINGWMDFVGATHYTIDKFLAEAEQFGITRRVGPNPAQLGSMSWGDVVTCVQREKGIKAYSAFVEFPITMLVGISPQAREMLSELCEVPLMGGEYERDEPEHIERECGSYEAGAFYSIDRPLHLIAADLRQFKADGIDIGKPMIGCMSSEVINIQQPYPRIRNILSQRSIRPFNRSRFWQEANTARIRLNEKGKGERYSPTVAGYYYIPQKALNSQPGIVREVVDYQRREELDKQKRALAKKAKQERESELTLF